MHEAPVYRHWGPQPGIPGGCMGCAVGSLRGSLWTVAWASGAHAQHGGLTELRTEGRVWGVQGGGKVCIGCLTGSEEICRGPIEPRGEQGALWAEWRVQSNAHGRMRRPQRQAPCTDRAQLPGRAMRGLLQLNLHGSLRRSASPTNKFTAHQAKLSSPYLWLMSVWEKKEKDFRDTHSSNARVQHFSRMASIMLNAQSKQSLEVKRSREMFTITRSGKGQWRPTWMWWECGNEQTRT